MVKGFIFFPHTIMSFFEEEGEAATPATDTPVETPAEPSAPEADVA